MSLYIGLMSGTSLDGIDGVLAEFAADGALQRVLVHAQAPLPAPLARELLALNAEGPDELQRAALASNALARAQAEVVADLLQKAGVSRTAVRAVGSHGQTVRHRPGELDATGFTLQLNNGALLAEACGIDVVCDFRSRDVAAGGQGAPLVPAFHQTVFGGAAHRAVLNVGGIANLTVLGPRLQGFDCGPGNVLMDLWCGDIPARLSMPTGAGGPRGGWTIALLAAMSADAYFAKEPPKSTGRDLFNAEWLARMLDGRAIAPQDVQATLLELTATAAIEALMRCMPTARELLVCGGGALNGALMGRLAALWSLFPGLEVKSTDSVGLPPQQVEATAFAWLAQRFCERQPGNHPAVTGAAGPRVLGALYPA